MYAKSSIFLIDIDGVACDHATAICAWVHHTYGVETKVENLKTWNHDFGPITFVEAVKTCYLDEDFILNMAVTDGFSSFFKHLENMMIIKFATARESSQEATRVWIKEKFGDYDTVFVKRKIDIEFDYLVDDSPEEAMSAAKKGKTCFVFNQPWNNNEDTRNRLTKFDKIICIKSFSDIIDCLKNER
jgi:5'(3')-deoxyribonucleotidase